jgi:serine/threonine-protein kinase
MHKIIRIPLYTFAFIVLGLAFGYLTFKILSFSRTVEVPNLYGKTLLESNKLLTDKGLYVKIEGEEFDSSVPPGNIIRQDVPAGNTVKERRGIKVLISKGPKVKSTPQLINETLANAESLLIEKRLKIGKVIMVHSDIVEKDKILAQSPGADEQASDSITVLVSLGPYEQIYLCPDFIGMSFEHATALIKNMNLKVSPEGSGSTVEAQKPDPGRQLKSGDIIYLKLS